MKEKYNMEFSDEFNEKNHLQHQTKIPHGMKKFSLNVENAYVQVLLKKLKK